MTTNTANRATVRLAGDLLCEQCGGPRYPHGVPVTPEGRPLMCRRRLCSRECWVQWQTGPRPGSVTRAGELAWLVEEGWSTSDICAELGLSAASLARWMFRYHLNAVPAYRRVLSDLRRMQSCAR